MDSRDKMTYEEFKKKMLTEPGFEDKVRAMAVDHGNRDNVIRAKTKSQQKRRAARRRLKR